MRCCLQTWDDMALRGDLTHSLPGDTIECAYAGGHELHRMRKADDGVWEWAHE